MWKTRIICTFVSQFSNICLSDFHLKSELLFDNKNSGWLRCVTAWGSVTGLSQVGLTKVKARKPFQFTESSLRVWNKEHLVDFVVTLYFTSLCCFALPIRKVSQSTLKRKQWNGVILSFVWKITFWSRIKSIETTRVSKNDISCHICSMGLKRF